MNLQTFIKKNIKYVVLFILFFLCLQFFYVNFSADQMYNYGFSYAISMGQIPYRDFNMIIPPVGAFIYSVPFLLFGSNLIIFNLYQALLLCVLFCFLFKLFKEKTWIILVILMLTLPIPFIHVLFQGYNFLLILEFVILMYLIKEKKNDYLIGILLGIFCLTKQTVGVLMCIPSVLYLFKDYKKTIKRFLGFLIPCFVFLIFLLLTKSFVQFFDLCLFGMFDFTVENSGFLRVLSDFNFYLFILEMIFLIYLIIKYRKNDKYIKNLVYLLLFSSIAVPLFDYIHVSYFSFIIMFIFIDMIKVKNKMLAFNSYLFASSFAIIWFLFIFGFRLPNIVYINNYGYSVMPQKEYKEITTVSEYITNNKNSIVLSDRAYLIKFAAKEKLSYYDLLNYGNHGYNGTDKLINMIRDEKDKYILINMDDYERVDVGQQTNKEVMKFVIDNYEKVLELEMYNVYYKE